MSAGNPATELRNAIATICQPYREDALRVVDLLSNTDSASVSRREVDSQKLLRRLSRRFGAKPKSNARQVIKLPPRSWWLGELLNCRHPKAYQYAPENGRLRDVSGGPYYVAEGQIIQFSSNDLRRLADLQALPDVVSDRLKSLGTISKPTLDRLIKVNRPIEDWLAGFVRELILGTVSPPLDLSKTQYWLDVLDQSAAEIVHAIGNDIPRLIADVESLIFEVGNSDDLPTDVQEFIVRNLARISDALRDVSRVGKLRLRESVEQLVGDATISRIDLTADILADRRWQRTMDIVTIVTALVGISAASFSIPADIHASLAAACPPAVVVVKEIPHTPPGGPRLIGTGSEKLVAGDEDGMR